MTKWVEFMIYLFSSLITSSFVCPVVVFLPSLVFSSIPMERQRNVFMLQNGCKINEFCVKCADFQLSLTYFTKRIWNAAEQFSLRHLSNKTFWESLWKGIAVQRFSKALMIAPLNIFIRRIVKLADNFQHLPLSSLVTCQQLLCA